MSDESLRKTGQIVPLRRGKGRLVHDEETRTRCFILFATVAGRNCATAAKLYAEEVAGFATPAPDRTTVALWASEDRWHTQADDLWRQTKGRTAVELQILFVSNTMLSQRRLHDILAGHDTRPIEERLVTLKAIETAMRSRERLPELARIEPPDTERDTSDRPRDERESLAKQALARRKDTA